MILKNEYSSKNVKKQIMMHKCNKFPYPCLPCRRILHTYQNKFVKNQ